MSISDAMQKMAQKHLYEKQLEKSVQLMGFDYYNWLKKYESPNNERSLLKGLPLTCLEKGTVDNLYFETFRGSYKITRTFFDNDYWHIRYRGPWNKETRGFTNKKNATSFALYINRK